MRPRMCAFVHPPFLFFFFFQKQDVVLIIPLQYPPGTDKPPSMSMEECSYSVWRGGRDVTTHDLPKRYSLVLLVTDKSHEG